MSNDREVLAIFVETSGVSLIWLSVFFESLTILSWIGLPLMVIGFAAWIVFHYAE